MEDAPPQKSRWHRRGVWLVRALLRLAVWAIVGGVVVFALYAVIINQRGDRAVSRVESALEDRGLLDRYPSTIRAAEQRGYQHGSSDYWRAAMDATPDPGELPLPQVGMVQSEYPMGYEYPESRQQYPREVVEAMRKVVDAHPLFWELVAAARAAESKPFGLGTGWQIYRSDARMLGGARSVARWLCMRAELAVAENDGGAFVDAILGVIDLNNALQDEPALIVELIRCSIDAIAYTTVFDAFSRIALSPAQLDRLIEAFDLRRRAHPVPWVLGNAISEEFHFVTRDTQNYLRDAEANSARFTYRIVTSQPDVYEMPEPESRAAVLWRDLLLATCPGRYELLHAETMDLAMANYDRVVALDEKPAERWDWLAQQAAEFDDEDNEPNDYRDMRTLYLIGAAKSMLSAQSNLAVTVAALRVERYRVEHGDWPATLADATGDVPRDARGQAILYRTAPRGVVVYNTGRDTVDQQGFHRQDHYDAAWPDADDHGAWLYDPDARNALPPPAFEPQTP